ncbi:UNVERIFIED_CONTAM: hypothetical protein HDU68_003302, partial [Siphonaria sp. JEL0065]
MSTPVIENEKKDLELFKNEALDGIEHGVDPTETLRVDEWGTDVIKAIVSAEDDPTEPVLTFRFWFLATFLGSFSGCLGQLYTFKPQTVSVSSLMLAVFGYVIGLGLAK